MLSSDVSLKELYAVEGQVALVTGGGSGIGRAVCELLARVGGAHIAVVDLPGTDGHRQLARELVDSGCTAAAIDGDVSQPLSVESVVAETIRRFGRIDILVNNAGIGMPLTIDETEHEDWRKTLSVHLDGTFLMSKAVLPAMMEQGAGVIIQMSSIVAHQGALRGHVAYATAKAGILGFTKTLARTAAPHGVRVNAVAPGMVDTEMLRATHGEKGIAEIARDIPLGRIASPRDIAAAVLFLASPAGANITGSTLDVNGGHHMR